MYRVLVTGATGFIGKGLCKRIVAEGWTVRGSVRSENQAHLLPREAEYVQIDSIGPDTDWTNALTDVETVIHLAGRAHIIKDTSFGSLSEYRVVNTAGTERLARFAASKGVRRFVFMSTVKVNGEGRASAYTEKDIPNPSDSYGISKWEAEKILKIIADQTGMEVVVIRAPIVYGPEVKANFLRLLRAVDQGIFLPFARINNKRSMIYLNNLVDVIMTCLTHPKANGTYFVRDNKDMSTPELIRLLAMALGKPERLFYLPLSLLNLGGWMTGNSKAIDTLTGSLTVDSSKIKRELGWEPFFSVEEGIMETVRYYKKECAA
ncbi:MAG: SDR family oxidoreductase [Deltaproteobacteria bacterium]|nr:SDR family oxidoreductase [Deltaproteobacteria bacterium]